MKRALFMAGAAIVMAGLLSASTLAAQEGFPHERHSVFFSECTACHAGVTSGDAAALFPEASFCAPCHDGSTAPAIGWEPREARVSSLAFTHTPHSFGCAMCHQPGGEEDLANLGFPEPETCVGCHAPNTEHKQAKQCDFCHARVVDFRLTGPGIAPPFHGEAFKESHWAAAASGQPDCASCHAESTCAQCHDGQDSRDFHPVNFLASHASEAFGRVDDCSSCHSTQAFCRECHTGLGIRGESNGLAPYHDGQSVWILSHPQAARQDLESCTTCHQQTDCLRCHSARSGMKINPHGAGYIGSVRADWSRAMCKACHIGVP